MAYESEAKLEANMLAQLSRQGYEEIAVPDYEALVANFRVQFEKFNKAALFGTPLSDTEFNRLLIDIEGIGVYKSAKILRGKQELLRDDNTIMYYRLFNTKEWCQNIFQVTSQVNTKGDNYNVRYDVTILMNGLPVIQIELKRRGIEFSKAFHQIKRYKKDKAYKGLYNFIQIFIGSNGVVTKYFSNSDYDTLESMTFYWTNANNEKVEVLSDFTDTFLEKCHAAKMIARYMIIKEASKDLMVMRPYQVYGAENILSQALETANNGYVWHSTGSGKTLTSFKVSQLLADNDKFKKVIFLVDRKDLDGQTIEEFNLFEEGSVDRTEDTYTLIKHLEDPNRKRIVTTIQKLNNALRNKRYTKIMEAFKDQPVAFIIDECHRSQFGEMRKTILQHFAKAQYFGFTGTPRFEENKSLDGRSTADLFGRCLHSYLIKNSIADGTTLPFSVEYVKTMEMVGSTDDEQVAGIQKKEAYQAPKRIEIIADDIIKDRKRKSERGTYNALFAVDSIDSLVKYYDSFAELNKKIDDSAKKLFIGAVFTYDPNEDMGDKPEHSRESLERIISDYNVRFGTNFSTESFSEYFTDVSKKIKDGSIDVMLVVNMFLTGFDSKKINTLYVDKNLEHHGLIQAFSRTNRVDKATKYSGHIRCYRNLKEKTDEAIKLFSQTDNTDVVLALPFEEQFSLVNDAMFNLLAIAPTVSDAGKLMGETEKRDFILAFREVARQLNCLQPFAKFDFDTSNLPMTEQQFMDFRSKYYDLLPPPDDGGAVSVLDDIDFRLDEILLDKINVDYILNLIYTSDIADDKINNKIKKTIRQSDSKEMKYKSEHLLAFMEQVAPTLSPEDSNELALKEFMAQRKAEKISQFADESSIDSPELEHFISDYEFRDKHDRKAIMAVTKLGFPHNKRMTDRVVDFIQSFVKEFSSSSY